MKKCLILSLIFLAFNTNAASKNNLGLATSPYFFTSSSNYTIDPGIDAGTISLWGLGAIVGIRTRLLTFGLEFRGAKPLWRPDDQFSPDRVENPIAETLYYAVGACLKIHLWRFTFMGSYFPLERLQFDPGDKYIGQSTYYYEGSSFSYGLGLRVYKSISVFAQLQKTTYSNYSRTEDITLAEGSFDRADRVERTNPLVLDSLVLGISTTLSFGNMFDITFDSGQ